jgi:hypothetical protein
MYCSQPLNWRRTFNFHKGLSSNDFCFSSVIEKPWIWVKSLVGFQARKILDFSACFERPRNKKGGRTEVSALSLNKPGSNRGFVRHHHLPLLVLNRGSTPVSRG